MFFRDSAIITAPTRGMKMVAPIEKEAKSHDDAIFGHGDIVQESYNLG